MPLYGHNGILLHTGTRFATTNRIAIYYMKTEGTKGKLYLIPNLLGGDDTGTIPDQIRQILPEITIFIVESTKQARRFLVKMGIKESGRSLDALTFYEIGEHADSSQFSHFLDAARNEGQAIGLISDAGCPAVADPGAYLVRLAHEAGIGVMPLVGPSSLLLALMGSGMGGQNFAFNGYLPIARHERTLRLKQLENRARQEQQTQLFIETPYRNIALFDDILATCKPDTRLCIAINLTLPDQFVRTLPIVQWRNLPQKPDMHKKTAVFIIGL